MQIVKIFILLVLFINFLIAKNLNFLSPKETTWINNFKNDIKIGVTQIPNQVIKSKNGKLKGFSIDLFNIIEKKLDIKFKYVYFNSWKALIDAAKNNKIDIVFLAQKTTSRLKFLYFTDTILSLKNKLIVNIENKYNSLKELKGHKIAITSGSALEEYLKFHYPEILFVSTKSELESIKFVKQKIVDATVIELVRASYYIKKLNLNDLIIASDITYDYYLSIACNKTLPELNIILSKTLKQIKKNKLEALKLKWGYIKDQKIFFNKQTMIYISIVFGITIPFLIYLQIMNKKLKREIEEKQKALKRVEKLRDSKLNEMSQIISMIAHQWRQPLNNLYLLIQTHIYNYKKGKIDKQAIQYFKENSKKQINLMSKTINDFMEFFKAQENKNYFDLKKTIEELLSIIEPLFKKNNIKISFYYEDNNNYTLNNYKNMFTQIIINILNNAKDALLERNIDNKQIYIELQNNDIELIILIKDNAGGIPEDIIDKVFDPYFSTKNEKNGTGLGLYISKIILEERMNGKIDVKNDRNGAIFKIIFPK